MYVLHLFISEVVIAVLYIIIVVYIIISFMCKTPVSGHQGNPNLHDLRPEKLGLLDKN